MKYKALMLDVDGTIVPYDYDAMPSDKVTEAIQKAQKKVAVCLVTGRSFGFVEHVLEKLQIGSGFAVVNNGANVVNIETNEVIYDQPINPKDVQEIISVLRDEKIDFYLKRDVEKPSHLEGVFKDETFDGVGYMFYTAELYSLEKIESVFSRLSHLNDLTLYKTKHREDGKYGLNISHINATKLHGIYVVSKELEIHPHEMIGAGDSYNDFPLLMACGLKVAMGNALPELKAIADYVAPSVDDDGVADIIEKYVLNEDQ